MFLLFLYHDDTIYLPFGDTLWVLTSKTSLIVHISSTKLYFTVNLAEWVVFLMFCIFFVLILYWCAFLQCPPFRLSYRGLGEPLCFAAFGPLATTAFYFSNSSRSISRYTLEPLVAYVVLNYCVYSQSIEGSRFLICQRGCASPSKQNSHSFVHSCWVDNHSDTLLQPLSPGMKFTPSDMYDRRSNFISVKWSLADEVWWSVDWRRQGCWEDVSPGILLTLFSTSYFTYVQIISTT